MKTLQNFYTVFLSVRVKCMNLAAVVNVRIVCYIYVRCAKRAIKKKRSFFYSSIVSNTSLCFFFLKITKFNKWNVPRWYEGKGFITLRKVQESYTFRRRNGFQLYDTTLVHNPDFSCDRISLTWWSTFSFHWAVNESFQQRHLARQSGPSVGFEIIAVAVGVRPQSARSFLP